jgi:Flp pilus assembly protein TadG
MLDFGYARGRAPDRRPDIAEAVRFLAMLALLGVAAFAIDVGYAYYAKRQLQSAVDAAALAGAQDLPDITTATATAQSYAAANTPGNISGYDQQPCHSAVNVASAAKAAGTTIYSIGYALGTSVKCTAGDFHIKNAQNQWVSCTLPTAGCFHYASNTSDGLVPSHRKPS